VLEWARRGLKSWNARFLGEAVQGAMRKEEHRDALGRAQSAS